MIRRFRWAVLPICLVLTWGASASAQEPGTSSPTVPLGHPMYEIMLELAQAGVETGLQDGAFCGRRPLLRSEFAHSLRTIFGQLTRWEGEGTARWRPRDLRTRLHAVAREFTPELLAAGAERRAIGDTVDRVDRAFRDSRPHGVAEPFASQVWPPDVEARSRGARAAVEEWSHGEVVLYATRPQMTWGDGHGHQLPPLSVDSSNAVPLQAIGSAEPSSAIREYVAGHNAELWAHLRREGLPAGSRIAWLKELFELRTVWQRRRTEALAESSKLAPTNGLPGIQLIRRSLIECFSPVNVPGVSNIQLPDNAAQASVLWGPPGSAVAYFQTGGSSGEKRYYAVDLRTGVVLNADWSRS